MRGWKKVWLGAVAGVMSLGVALGSVSGVAMAADPNGAWGGQGGSEMCDYLKGYGELSDVAGCNNHDTLGAPVASIIKVVLWAVGLMSVVMIIVGGVQMTTSAGNTSAVEKAKKTILYAVIGLIISVLAYVIVEFVLTKTTG